MIPEDLDADLTAYALNDPGLTPDRRAALEARLAADPTARQAVEETAALGRHLTAALSIKAEPAVDSPMVLTVAAAAKPRARWAVPAWAAALAACVMFGLGIGVAKWGGVFRTPESMAGVAVDSEKRSGGQSAPSDPSNLLHDELGLDANHETVVPLSRDAEPSKEDKFAAPMPVAVPALPVPASPYTGSIAPAPAVSAGTLTITGGGTLTPGEAKPVATSGTTATTLIIPHSAPPVPPDAWPTYVPYNNAARKSTLGKMAGEGKPSGMPTQGGGGFGPEQGGRDAYPQLIENPFTEVKGQAALSTFGVDVDTASYSIVRNYLNHNGLPPADAVRLEEMVNYFPYKDAPPEGNDPYAVRVEMAECPWQPGHKLARIALKAKPIDNGKRPPSNLVFLIDVSGSMDAPNRLPLVKAAMKLLVGQLGENDKVALVVYAGASGLVLDSTRCDNKESILKALDDLTPGGSTHGSSGIQLAYDVAVRNFVPKGTNRVILCTDGDWNVGTTSTDALIKLIEQKRTTGVFLSVFGFGMGNLRDEMMVQLAGKGNGNYAYIDTIAEAKKALVEQVSGTLVTVAKDVKIQIEFNPARVASYRLLGYEKRILASKEFHDDKKDAGEMGAGHVVTALYELVPAGAAAEPKVNGLRYQPKVEAPKAPPTDDKTAAEAFVLKLRHKMPDKDESVLREIAVADEAKPRAKASDDFQFASAVAAFAMLMKDSPYRGGASFALVEELAAASMTNDPGAYRAEFLQLVKKAKSLKGGK